MKYYWYETYQQEPRICCNIPCGFTLGDSCSYPSYCIIVCNVTAVDWCSDHGIILVTRSFRHSHACLVQGILSCQVRCHVEFTSDRNGKINNINIYLHDTCMCNCVDTTEFHVFVIPLYPKILTTTKHLNTMAPVSGRSAHAPIISWSNFPM